MRRGGLIRRFGRARGGATAVEFAIVVMPFILLTFGVLEFGRLVWTRQALEEAAVAGARCMGVLSSSCASGGAYSATSTSSYIITRAQGWGVTLPTADVTLSNASSCAGVTGFSQVSIAYTFTSPVASLLSMSSTGVPLAINACFPNQS